MENTAQELTIELIIKFWINELDEMVKIHWSQQDEIDQLNSFYQNKVKCMEREIGGLKSEFITLKKMTDSMVNVIEIFSKNVDNLKIEFETKIERFMQDQLDHMNNQTSLIDEYTNRIAKQTTLINHYNWMESVGNRNLRGDLSCVDHNLSDANVKLSNMDSKVTDMSSQMHDMRIQTSVTERFMEAILAILGESDQAKSTSSFANSRNKHAKVGRSFDKFSDMSSICFLNWKLFEFSEFILKEKIYLKYLK